MDAEPLPSTPSNSKPSGITHFRWVICGLLFFATLINYVDRQILSLVRDDLDKFLHWSDTQFGFANSLFQISYGLSLLGFGWFIDRFGTRLGYATSIAAWSMMALAHALVGSVTGFYVARVGLGIGEAGNFPSAIKATAQWFPQRERALATAIFNSGASVASVAAPLTIPFVAHAFGWKATFMLAGAAGFVWLGAWWFLFRLPEDHPSVGAAELMHIRDGTVLAPPRRLGWGEVLPFRQTWSFIVAKFLTDPVWWFYLVWLPKYFKDGYKLDILHSSKHLATTYAIVTVLSIFGGWVPGWLVRRGWTITRARKASMFVFALCALPVYFITWQHNVWAVVVMIGFGGAAHQAWSANLFTTVSDMFPRTAVATVVGIGGLAGSVGGFLFPLLTGVLLDHYKLLGQVTRAYPFLFGYCGLAYIVAFGIHHLLAPSFRSVVLMEPAAQLPWSPPS